MSISAIVDISLNLEEKIINIDKYSLKGEEKMKKKEIPTKYKGKWILLDNKNNKVIYSSDNVADVVKKGREYKYNKVSIEKKLEPGTCFF